MIEVLPDMPAGVTGIRVSGRLLGDDLREFKPALEEMLKTGEIRIVEIPEHPFFVATLFLPQARSTPESPHPLLKGYAAAVIACREARARLSLAQP